MTPPTATRGRTAANAAATSDVSDGFGGFVSSGFVSSENHRADADAKSASGALLRPALASSRGSYRPGPISASKSSISTRPRAFSETRQVRLAKSAAGTRARVAAVGSKNKSRSRLVAFSEARIPFLPLLDEPLASPPSPTKFSSLRAARTRRASVCNRRVSASKRGLESLRMSTPTPRESRVARSRETRARSWSR